MEKVTRYVMLSFLFIFSASLATTYQPDAASFEEAVDRADLIVTGTLSLVRYSNFYGYNSDGSDSTIEQRQKEMPAVPLESLRLMGLPLVEYEVIPLKSFKGEIDEPIILRVMIEPLERYLTESMDKERMFLLTRNGNGDTYGMIGFDAILEKDASEKYKYARIAQDSEEVSLQELPYISPEDAVDEVFESLIANRVSVTR